MLCVDTLSDGRPTVLLLRAGIFEVVSCFLTQQYNGNFIEKVDSIYMHICK
jgi:hypothetical protein